MDLLKAGIIKAVMQGKTLTKNGASKVQVRFCFRFYFVLITLNFAPLRRFYLYNRFPSGPLITNLVLHNYEPSTQNIHFAFLENYIASKATRP